MSNFIIALDGPSGSGKSTIANILAKKLKISYLNTGSMYRAVTLFFLENNIENLLNNSLVSYKTASDKAIWGKDKDAKKNIEIEKKKKKNRFDDVDKMITILENPPYLIEKDSEESILGKVLFNLSGTMLYGSKAEKIY